MATTDAEGPKRWGRLNEAQKILGVSKKVTERVMRECNVPVRMLPSVAHRRYDLDFVRRIVETAPAGTSPPPPPSKGP